MPHEAIEYIMAYSGELFDPQLVQLFVKDVPLYPAGVMVKLNTGESGVVTQNNPGNLGRPIIRMFFNKRGRPRRNTYDANLSHAEFQDRIVVEVMDY